jgi:TolB-like protein/Tfp pilus assembly protein PilF
MARLRLAFGPFVLNPETGMLLRQGLPVPVGYRGMLLLRALLEQPGDVVTKSDLMDAAWQGAAVEESNLSVQIASLRKLLGPMPGGGDWIVTVSRIGYRFVGTVEIRDGESADDKGSEPGPSIAVLPFTNLSEDSGQQYFAEGLAEDIITRLARLRWLFVAARTSSFTYGGKPVSVQQVGRDLGVRYVLDGSVRRSGQHLRIGAELSEAATGLQVWAHRYDADVADFFALQDEIAESVIAAIEPRLYAAEHRRVQRRSPDTLDAWGFVMQAMPYVYTWVRAEEIEAAEALLRRALEIDPEYPRAHSLLAWSLAARAQLGSVGVREALAAARARAQTAIRLDPEDPWAHFAAGFAHMSSRGTDAAVAELSEAIELNPSLAFAHAILGCTYGYAGMAADGLHHCALAAKLSPRGYFQPATLAVTGLCHLMARRFAEAVAFERRAVELRPDFGMSWRTLTAAAGLAGELELARGALAEARRLQPTLSVEWVEQYHGIVREEDRAMYLDGLRAAGLE